MDDRSVITNLTAADFVITVRGERVSLHSVKLATPTRFVLVLDGSGSMNGASDSSPASRIWSLTVDLAKTIVASARNGTEAALVAFRDTQQTSVPLTGNLNVIQAQLEQERFNPRRGKTLLWDWLSRSLEMLGPVRDGDFLVVITDGEENNSEMDFEKLRRELMDKRIRVFPVLVSDTNPLKQDPPLLERWLGIRNIRDLATQSGGIALGFQPRLFSGRPTNEITGFQRSLADTLFAMADLSYAITLDSVALIKREKLKVELTGQHQRIRLLYQPTLGPCRN